MIDVLSISGSVARRSILLGLGASLVGGVPISFAANAVRRIVIAFPRGTAEQIRSEPIVGGFISEISRLAEREGWTIDLSIMSGNGEIEDYPKIAARAVAASPDLIFVATSLLTRQMKAMNTSIPVVACLNDPAANGVVSVPASPTSNFTGVDLSGGSQLFAARLEILRQAGLSFIRPAFLTPSLFDLRGRVNELRPTWKGLIPVQLEAPMNEASLRVSFKVMIDEGADAVLVTNSALLVTYRDLFVSLARQYRIPAIYPYRSYVEAGGLISYGLNFFDQGKIAAAQTVRVLKGEAPGSIPFHSTTDYEIAVNLKAARALNVTIADGVIARAALVID